MRYTTPTVATLGRVHALTLDPGGDNDPKNDACSGSIRKCLGTGDGRSQEAGFGGGFS
jgi:hypothetical protein